MDRLAQGALAQPVEIPESVLEKAAQWYALLRSDDASDAERREWQRWLAAHVHHQLAWQWVERIGQRFAPIQRSPDRDAAVHALQRLSEHGRRRRQLLLGLGAVTATGAIGWSVVRHSPLPGLLQAYSADYRTATGELRDLQLPDGSTVWLNARSSLDQHFDTAQRGLRLHAGEAFIETVGDARRPLRVQAGHGTVQALRTRFNVRVEQDATLVGVYRGTVEIRTAANDLAMVLRAGQQVRFTRSELGEPTVASLAREAWTRGVILAQDISLRELVEELSRYRRGVLMVADEVAHLRVFGSFPARDPEAALALLTQALPVQVRHRWGWWGVIQGRDE